MISKIDDLLEKIPHIVEALYQNDVINANKSLAEVFPEINRSYLYVINRRSIYEAEGTEVPVEILISQMKNMLEAYESKDVIMLADSLKYEIYEGLCYCRDLLRSEHEK